MSARCVGGMLDGMPVYTREDAVACTEGGGSVVGDNGGGCGSTTAARMVHPSQPSLGEEVPASKALKAFRRIRTLASDHPIVQAALTLNSISAKEIERIGEEHSEMRPEFARALETLGNLVDEIMVGNQTDKTYDRDLHAQLAQFGQTVTEKTDNIPLKQGITFLLSLAEPMIGMRFGDIADRLTLSSKPSPTKAAETENSDMIAKTLVVTNRYPSSAVITAARQGRLSALYSDVFASRKFPSAVEIRFAEAKAKKAIDEKARALGGWIGERVGDGEFVTGGYRQVFEFADLYVGANNIAYEVHGEIRRKYDFLHGPNGPLGLPVTDETGTPDGVGRYNHFEHGGSIYWTPMTGPMMVSGVIRNLWASQGWELGSLGYPVQDEYRLPVNYPTQVKSDVAWCEFQNGLIFAKGNAAAKALAAEIQPDSLRSLIRTFFDRRLHAFKADTPLGSIEAGLEAPVDVLNISDWGYGFLAAVPRTITYRLHGFISVPIASDPTFQITIRLRFGTAWPMSFAYPSILSIIVALDWLSVSVTSPYSKVIADMLFQAIDQSFNRGGPDPDHPEVPNGSIFLAHVPTNVNQSGSGNIDIIDVHTTAQGGLQILVNPLPPSLGGLRQLLAQNQITAFLEGF